MVDTFISESIHTKSENDEMPLADAEHQYEQFTLKSMQQFANDVVHKVWVQKDKSKVDFLRKSLLGIRPRQNMTG